MPLIIGLFVTGGTLFLVSVVDYIRDVHASNTWIIDEANVESVCEVMDINHHSSSTSHTKAPTYEIVLSYTFNGEGFTTSTKDTVYMEVGDKYPIQICPTDGSRVYYPTHGHFGNCFFGFIGLVLVGCGLSLLFG